LINQIGDAHQSTRAMVFLLTLGNDFRAMRPQPLTEAITAVLDLKANRLDSLHCDLS
jgi:hypothetical protein